MDRPLRALQPAGPVDRPHDIPPVPPSQAGKRKHISVACNACRKRKSRCDGLKPKCHSCKTKGSECVYDSTRRKSFDVQARNSEVEHWLSQTSNLFDHMRRCPSPEAQSILRRIRVGEDVYRIAEEVMGTDSLLASTDDLDLSQVGASVGGSSSSQTPGANIQGGNVPEQRNMLLPALQPGLDDFSTANPDSGLPWLQANTGMAQFENLDDAQYPTYPFEMPSITGQGAGVDILADAARQNYEQQQGDDSSEQQ